MSIDKCTVSTSTLSKPLQYLYKNYIFFIQMSLATLYYVYIVREKRKGDG